MVAHAHIVEAQVAQDVFGLFNHAELLRGHGFAIRDTRAEAGHLGLVGRGQAKLGGERPDVRFGQAGFFQRGAHLELRGGLGAGAVIAQVAGVFTVSDDGQALGFGQRGQLGEQFVLAEVAAVVRVSQVAGVLKLAGPDGPDGEPELAGQRQGLLQFTPGQAGRVGNGRERLLAEHVVRDVGKEHRVHAARVGHQAGAVGAEESAQPFVFVRDHVPSFACNASDVEEGIAVARYKVESGLDGWGKYGCIATMKTKISVVLLGALVLVVGCVKTVNDRKTFALSPYKDKFESRYERSVDQVYAASVDVIKLNGAVARESIINPGSTNQLKAIEGKVNGRNVWVRVQAVDPKITSVKVQVRTTGGGTDQDLTAELQKQIAINLATR